MGATSPAYIYLREGVYTQTEPVNLTAMEAGKSYAGLTIKAYKNESVRINAGTDIPVSQLIAADSEFKSKIIEQSTADNIMMINLRNLGINDFGEISRRGHQVSANLPAQMEVSVDGGKQRLARWPNNNFVGFSEIVEYGTRTAEGITEGCAFKVDYDRPTKWASPQNVWVSGVLGPNFAYDYYPIQSVEIDTKVIRLREGAIKDYYSRQFFIYENIPEELDEPGEYYIDRETGVLYIYPPFGAQTITLSGMHGNVIQLSGTKNLTIENIEIEGGRNSAVHGTGTENITLRNCKIHGFGNSGITLSDTRYSVIRDCEIYDTGKNAVFISGGNYTTLEGSGNLVYNNRIHDFSNLEKSYTSGVYIGYQSVGVRVENNRIYNSPHAGMIFYGNNHLIIKNEFENLVTEFHDMDAVYVNNSSFPWERGTKITSNFFHNIGNKTFNGQRQMNIAAIRTDNNGHGLNIFGNVFYNIGLGGTNAVSAIRAQGTRNKIKNNIFVDCSETYNSNNTYISGRTYDMSNSDVIALKTKMDQYIPVYSIMFPELLNFWNEHFSSARTNEFKNNLIVNIAFSLSTINGAPNIEGFRGAGELVDASGNYRTLIDPGFVDYQNKDFGLNKNSDVFLQIPGFLNIFFNTIGCVD